MAFGDLPIPSPPSATLQPPTESSPPRLTFTPRDVPARGAHESLSQTDVTGGSSSAPCSRARSRSRSPPRVEDPLEFWMVRDRSIENLFNDVQIDDDEPVYPEFYCLPSNTANSDPASSREPSSVAPKDDKVEGQQDKSTTGSSKAVEAFWASLAHDYRQEKKAESATRNTADTKK